MSDVIAVSEAVSLAFHGMGILVRSARMSAREMAKSVDVSEAHLAKVFQRLVKAGLVDSTRGPGGGFELARKPGDILLFDIYAAIEGIPEGSHCLLHKPRCPFRNCIFGSILGKMTEEFLDYLKNTTLEDIRRGEAE